MFTGIIEAVGEIQALDKRGEDIRLTVHAGELDLSDVKLGDSIANNGVCLTVVALYDRAFAADVSAETIKYTGFAHYQVGSRVNLEKAMLPTSRFGGHIVSGHVDGVGTVSRIIDQQKYIEVWVKAPQNLLKYIAHKGSITVDGVSLTVNQVNNDELMLWLIPHTLEKTIIADYQVGSLVNLEVDLVARYLERLMLGTQAEKKADISREFLAQHGFLK